MPKSTPPTTTAPYGANVIDAQPLFLDMQLRPDREPIAVEREARVHLDIYPTFDQALQILRIMER